MKSTQMCILCMGFVKVTLAEPRLSTVYIIHFVFRPTVLYLPQIHQKLRETGSFGKVCELGHDRRSATIEEYVVDRVEKDLNVSSRILARKSGICK